MKILSGGLPATALDRGGDWPDLHENLDAMLARRPAPDADTAAPGGAP